MSWREKYAKNAQMWSVEASRPKWKYFNFHPDSIKPVDDSTATLPRQETSNCSIGYDQKIDRFDENGEYYRWDSEYPSRRQKGHSSQIESGSWTLKSSVSHKDLKTISEQWDYRLQSQDLEKLNQTKSRRGKMLKCSTARWLKQIASYSNSDYYQQTKSSEGLKKSSSKWRARFLQRNNSQEWVINSSMRPPWQTQSVNDKIRPKLYNMPNMLKYKELRDLEYIVEGDNFSQSLASQSKCPWITQSNFVL
jgi:hypothetical protein